MQKKESRTIQWKIKENIEDSKQKMLKERENRYGTTNVSLGRTDRRNMKIWRLKYGDDKRLWTIRNYEMRSKISARELNYPVRALGLNYKKMGNIKIQIKLHTFLFGSKLTALY